MRLEAGGRREERGEKMIEGGYEREERVGRRKEGGGRLKGGRGRRQEERKGNSGQRGQDARECQHFFKNTVKKHTHKLRQPVIYRVKTRKSCHFALSRKKNMLYVSNV